MKINGIQAQSVYESYSGNSQAANSDAKTNTEAAGSTDKLELSSKASGLKESNAIAQQYLTADTSRSEKIENIKNKIDSGEYSVSAKDVAKSILKGIFLDTKG